MTFRLLNIAFYMSSARERVVLDTQSSGFIN